MTIIHLEDEPWDSGIAHYALTLAAEQARRGHRVSVWGRADSPVLKKAAELGLATRGLAAWPWLNFFALRRELATLEPRVLNAHTGSAHALALALRPTGAAVVRTRGDARSPRGGLLARLSARRTQAFVAANSALRDELETALPGARVRLVPQGIAGPPFAAPLPDLPVVGMIARFDPVKGHEVLLTAAPLLKQQVRGLRLLCAGEGALREQLAWRLPLLGLKETVEFPGRVADPWAFLARCRVGVVPSTGSEAVSRAALEWMAAGRPLVASRVGGIPDLVEEGVTGLLVPPRDAAALAAALKALLTDPARAEAMGRAGRARWEKLFSPAPFYEATQRVYDQATDFSR